MKACSLEEIAAWVGGEVFTNGPLIRGASSLELAGPGDLTFYADRRYHRQLLKTRAAAVLLQEPQPDLPIGQVVHPSPLLAFVKVLEQLSPTVNQSWGISPQAHVDSSAEIGPDVWIAPFAVIEAGARVGRGSRIGSGCVVERSARLGDGCRLEPHSIIRASCLLGNQVIIGAGSVIGSDGFHFVKEGEGHRRIPALGRVVIEDGVEVGALCTVDKPMVGMTRIGSGCRLDHHVHLAHGVALGPHCLLAAQVGIAGSSELGHSVYLGGQVGISDHCQIGDGARVAAGSGVHGRVLAGEIVAGIPQLPISVWRKVSAALPKIPDLLRRVRRLEQLKEKEGHGDKT